MTSFTGREVCGCEAWCARVCRVWFARVSCPRLIFGEKRLYAELTTPQDLYERGFGWRGGLLTAIQWCAVYNASQDDGYLSVGCRAYDAASSGVFRVWRVRAARR